MVAWPGADPALAPRRPPVLLPGIAAQQYHIRQLRPKAAGPRQGSERRTLPAAELESALWKQARVAPEAAAESSGLGAEEIGVLREQSGEKLATVGEVVLALGRLGQWH